MYLTSAFVPSIIQAIEERLKEKVEDTDSVFKKGPQVAGESTFANTKIKRPVVLSLSCAGMDQEVEGIFTTGESQMGREGTLVRLSASTRRLASVRKMQ